MELKDIVGITSFGKAWHDGRHLKVMDEKTSYGGLKILSIDSMYYTGVGKGIFYILARPYIEMPHPSAVNYEAIYALPEINMQHTEIHSSKNVAYFSAHIFANE